MDARHQGHDEVVDRVEALADELEVVTEELRLRVDQLRHGGEDSDFADERKNGRAS